MGFWLVRELRFRTNWIIFVWNCSHLEDYRIVSSDSSSSRNFFFFYHLVNHWQRYIHPAYIKTRACVRHGFWPSMHISEIMPISEMFGKRSSSVTLECLHTFCVWSACFFLCVFFFDVSPWWSVITLRVWLLTAHVMSPHFWHEASSRC